jgi:hypothetical protein
VAYSPPHGGELRLTLSTAPITAFPNTCPLHLQNNTWHPSYWELPASNTVVLVVDTGDGALIKASSQIPYPAERFTKS